MNYNKLVQSLKLYESDEREYGNDSFELTNKAIKSKFEEKLKKGTLKQKIEETPFFENKNVY